MYLHCVACMWFFIIDQNHSWIPPLDYLYIETTLYEQSYMYKYWISLYHSVLLLSGNDVGPRGDFQVSKSRRTFQIAFGTACIVMGAMINANIFGNMAVLLQGINRKAAQFQEKLDTANTAMKNMKISDDLL